ncbi:zinc finger, GRF-type containing protein [Tanacetum coccineum]
MEMEGNLVTSSGFKLPSTDVPAKGWIYVVFLSFRGEDTLTNFVDHLYEALYRACIYTFKDYVKLLQGIPISWELVKVIEQAKLDKHNKIVVIPMIRTSRTNRNLGRRFYGCPTLSPTCVNFLRWYDPPMCQRFVQIIPGLLRSRNDLEEIVAMMQLLASVNNRRAIIEELERLLGNFVVCMTTEHLKRIQKAIFVEAIDLKKELHL